MTSILGAVFLFTPGAFAGGGGAMYANYRCSSAKLGVDVEYESNGIINKSWLKVGSGLAVTRGQKRERYLVSSLEDHADTATLALRPAETKDKTVLTLTYRFAKSKLDHVDVSLVTASGTATSTDMTCTVVSTNPH